MGFLSVCKWDTEISLSLSSMKIVVFECKWDTEISLSLSSMQIVVFECKWDTDKYTSEWVKVE